MSVSMIPPAYAPSFLACNGWAGAEILPLAADASFRRYFRVRRDGRNAVLMDAPPQHDDPRPFIAVAEWLVENQFSAPRIMASDLDQGLVLLEDFGDIRMRETLDDNPALERGLYREVVSLLAILARQPAMALKPYDLNEYQRELAIFTDWYCPDLGLEVDVAGYTALWDRLLAPVIAQTQPAVTVLRDYHAENIMLIKGREGIARLGLLDFQDALAGHPAYDLASLLQDARRDVSAGLEDEMLRHYHTISSPAAGFDDAYHVLAAQRNLKILGIFTRLWRRDGKPRYRSFQPRMWGYVERSLNQPVLAPLKAWLDYNIPVPQRAAAWAEFI